MTDLFQDNGLPPVDQQGQSFVEALVGENKKFKDIESLAKGKLESDTYIKQLEARLDELREDYLKLNDERNAGKDIQELVDQIQRQQQLNSNTTRTKEVDSPPALDPKMIESLVTTKVQEIEMQKKQEDNFNLAMKTLKDHYGDNFPVILKQTVDELGLTPDYVNQMARTQPKALFKLLGVGEQPPQADLFQAPPRTTRNDQFSPTAANKRTWSYYQKVKKENPALYLDAKTQLQMHKDLEDLGEAFKDGDFYDSKFNR